MMPIRIHSNPPTWLVVVLAALACGAPAFGEPATDDDIWRDTAASPARQFREDTEAQSYQPTTEAPAAQQVQVPAGAVQGKRSGQAGGRVGWADLTVVGLFLGANCTALVYVSICLLRTEKRTRDLDQELHRYIEEASATAKPETFAAPGTGLVQDDDGAREGRKSSQEALPRVVVAEAVLQELVGGINAFRKERPGVETGYALVGRVEGTGDGRQMVVCGLIPAGEEARYSPGQVEFDRVSQQAELTALQILDPRACHIGDAHLHPGCYDRCSPGDYQTDLGNVQGQAAKEMVFVIATVHPGREARSADSLCSQGLKLDFFYLGKSSGYEYRKVFPDVVSLPALKAGPMLRAYVKADPVRARLDFGNLRRLTGFTMRVLEGPDALADKGHLCVELAHRGGRYKAMILVSPDPAAAPTVVIEQGRDMTEFRPEFLDGRWVPEVWLTPIAAAVEREMDGADSRGPVQNLDRGHNPYEGVAAAGRDPGRTGLTAGLTHTV